MTNKKLPQFLPEKSPRTVISPLELAAEIEKDMAYQARIGLEAGITLNAEKCLVAIEALRCARPEAPRSGDVPLFADARVGRQLQADGTVTPEQRVAGWAVAAPHNHIENLCGFDRNSSLTEGCYVCDCGWRDLPAAWNETIPSPLAQINRLSNAHRLNIEDVEEALFIDRGHHCDYRTKLDAILQRSNAALKAREPGHSGGASCDPIGESRCDPPVGGQ